MKLRFPKVLRRSLSYRIAATIVLVANGLCGAPALAQILPSSDLPPRMGSLPDQATVAGGARPTADGPIELQQPVDAPRVSDLRRELPAIRAPLPPSEFERFVNSVAPESGTSATIRRFGSDLVTDVGLSSSTLDPLPAVPDDYIVKPGDEIALTIWGSVDASLRLTVDRAGLIAVPRVGAIEVAGLRYADLAPTLSHRVSKTFNNFQLTASLGRLRAVRVFVSGYVQNPGSLSVSAISSVLQALMRAGGPSQAGSFRDIRLTRRGKLVSTYDLYDLLLKGDRRADELVQSDDVIFVGPARTQVAVLGSVQQQAIFELQTGEVLDDALRMAGGFSPVADRKRVSIERLADRMTGHVTQLALPEHASDRLDTGDIVTAYSVVTAALPQGHQNKRVHVDGEVSAPGDYLLPPGSTISDALRAAGGMTAAAYPFGSEFDRKSVRHNQQVNYDRALRELETNIARSEATQHVASSEENTARQAFTASNSRLLETLRALTPTGRVVLELGPDDKQLPNLALEDGDSLHIPARDTSVGVFGSVFSGGSFLYRADRTTDQYLRLAGGPTRGADKHSMFVIQANGTVVSAQQGASFWHSGNDFHDTVVLPGDTIFVPEELDKSTFVQDAKDWTQIFYQFGLGIAGIKALGL